MLCLVGAAFGLYALPAKKNLFLKSGKGFKILSLPLFIPRQPLCSLKRRQGKKNSSLNCQAQKN